MKKSQLKVAVVLSLTLLLTAVLSAFAAPDGNTTNYKLRLKNVTIGWYVPPEGYSSETCSEFPPGIYVKPDDNGSNRNKTAKVTELPNGTTRVWVQDLVTGIAHDNHGRSYRFTYRNSQSAVLDGDVVSVRMIDEFVLKGPVRHRAAFKWSWQYNADTLGIHQEYDANGKVVDMWIDPFQWPDQVIIPGSFVEHYSAGGGISCDPI
jgi:hypothetical protein